MGSLVFVTRELSPFTAGGIGRMIHNALRSLSEADRARSVVLLVDTEVAPASFSAVFPSVTLVRLDTGRAGTRSEDGLHYPPAWAYSDSDWHWRSGEVYRALRRLSAERSIDYVEFPDWGALGFATVQEKRLAGFLDDAVVAVRLHSSHGLLASAEAVAGGPLDRALIDLETKTLRDCDLIIGALEPVASAMRNVLALPRDDWSRRLAVHVPPVVVDSKEVVGRSIAASMDMPVLFGAKLQRVKRPDLFIRGFGGLVQGMPTFRGKGVLAAHAFDEAYRAELERLVRPDLRERVEFVPGLQGSVRETLIGTSTFVVPSAFESLCLAAYEASMLGARVILNGRNPAFGDGTPWRDGVNCFKFDGTARGLAAALQRNFERPEPLEVARVPEAPWPWEQAAGRAPRVPAVVGHPLVSVVIPHYNLGEFLPEALNSVVEQTYPNIEIVLVDDCSTDPLSRALIDRLAASPPAGCKVVRNSANLGLAGTRNHALDVAEGKYVLPLDADDLLDRRFVEVAVRGLERNPDFDVVVTQAGYFSDDVPRPMTSEERDFQNYAVFFGEGLVSGTTENRFSTATAMLRADTLRRYRYEESLQCYEDWNLYLRLAQDGRRFLVTTAVYFHYRDRHGSMVKDALDAGRRAIFFNDLLRTSLDVSKLPPLAYLGFAQVAPGAGAAGVRGNQPVSAQLEDLLWASLGRQVGARAPAWRRIRRRLTRPPRSLRELAISRQLRSSILFDEDWYLAAHPDVQASGADPVLHYIRHGAKEGRDPGPFFSTTGYLQANPDVQRGGINPLLHYIRHGFRERRRLHPDW